MKIYLTDQKDRLGKHLAYFKTQEVMRYDKTSLSEKKSSVIVNASGKITLPPLDFLFDYRIFPPEIMIYLTEWQEEKREMQVGDTIVQQVYIPPVKSFSQKIVFAVRVNEIIDEPERKGFSYQTLEGHVEMGISTFTIEQSEAGMIFKIHTFSRSGNILSRVLGPLFSVPYQTYCTNKAVQQVKQQLEKLL